MVDFYRTEEINRGMKAIRSLTGEIMYLIEGENRACLIDTCVGVGHLKQYVEALTDKPVTVILTHGHIDHAMGAPEFSDVYMNPADEHIYNSMNGIEDRKGYLVGNLGGNKITFKREDFVPEQKLVYKPLADGDIFELGGISIEVYSLGGHTKGTMVILVPEYRLLITGDACNNATFLFDKNSLTVEEYRENLCILQQKLEDRFDHIYLMHHRMEASHKLMIDAISVCDAILAGKADDVEFHFMGNIGYIAKRANAQFVRADGGEANIIYNKDKIFK